MQFSYIMYAPAEGAPTKYFMAGATQNQFIQANELILLQVRLRCLKICNFRPGTAEQAPVNSLSS